MSWVIVEKATGKAVFETFKQSVADAINRNKYDVVEAGEYLVGLNAKIKADDRARRSYRCAWR